MLSSSPSPFTSTSRLDLHSIFKMKAFLLPVAACVALVQAADLSGFVAGPNVEKGLKSFLETYFPFSEDPAATTTWADWWEPTGSITFRGQVYTGAEARIALKQVILPSSGEVTWNHIVGKVVISAETATSKTYTEDVVVEVGNKVSGQCNGFQGQVIAEINKNADGTVNLEHHGANYRTYILDLPAAPNAACRVEHSEL
ncbi:hypothetical protein HJFPF1_12350 [Paramyrothecium foliicola]|nr:hypothetical protein HJFPF1_12350 [Paramyrothecium foliicola]